MKQEGVIFLAGALVTIELPSSEEEVMPGVRWGKLEAFPTPAYWAYQVLARRLTGTSIRNRLGQSLREEVAACLLGGHGIPAAVGVSAFQHLRAKGAFSGAAPSETELVAWLSEPIAVGGREIRYRFAKQKAGYLAEVLSRLDQEVPPQSSGKALRDWLLASRGFGPKTAGWVARNWLDADDIAIIDIHIYRAGLLGGFFDASLSVERNYFELEDRFLRLSAGLGVRSSELDGVIWYEMMSSASTVAKLLRNTEHSPRVLRRSSKNRHANANQLTLV